MNIQHYISSGILELYVMDQLTEAQRHEVETLRTQHPEIGTEINKIESVLEQVAFAESATLPAHLEDATINKIKASQTNNPESQIQNPKSPASITLPTLQAVRSIKPFIYGMVASAALALTAAGAALYFHNQIADNQSQVSACHLSTQQLQQDNGQLEKELFVLKAPSFMKVMMMSPDSTKHDAACVFWDPHTQEVYIDDCNLHNLDPNSQYEAWATIDNKMVSLGVFDHSHILQKVKPTAKSTAFVITVGKKGGAEIFNQNMTVVKGRV